MEEDTISTKEFRDLMGVGRGAWKSRVRGLQELLFRVTGELPTVSYMRVRWPVSFVKEVQNDKTMWDDSIRLSCLAKPMHTGYPGESKDEQITVRVRPAFRMLLQLLPKRLGREDLTPSQILVAAAELGLKRLEKNPNLLKKYPSKIYRIFRAEQRRAAQLDKRRSL